MVEAELLVRAMHNKLENQIISDQIDNKTFFVQNTFFVKSLEFFFTPEGETIKIYFLSCLLFSNL